RNGLGNGLTPEISIGYYINQTSEYYDYGPEGHSQYTTSHISADLRLRYYPLNTSYWAPYAFAGVGALMYDVQDVPYNWDPNKDAPEDELSGTTVFFPIGVGITHFFSKRWGLDFNFGLQTSLTDNLNPIYDNINDGSWNGKLSVLFKLLEFAKDSDGDGLSDEEEAFFGTNPNNPDTDSDGLLDGEEVKEYNTDPKNKDSDGGGVMDGIEVQNGANPLDPDNDIQSIAPGGNLILRNMEFATGKADITEKSELILGIALKALQAASDMEVEIVGHTDDIGKPEDNLILSADRAESVKAWLVNKGIAATRLSTRGAGQNDPIVPNTSDANRQKNRRIEFIRTK
ncbi:OmpA family protein, partial [Bacteroidota bacterium]